MLAGVESQRSPEGEAQISPSERRAWMPVANVPRHDMVAPEPRWTLQHRPSSDADLGGLLDDAFQGHEVALVATGACLGGIGPRFG